MTSHRDILLIISSVVVDVLEKFPIESQGSNPCVKHTLAVMKGIKDTSVTLYLSNPGKLQMHLIMSH